MSGNRAFVAIFTLLIALLVACEPMGTESGVGEPAETPETGRGAAAAVAHLAGELGVAEAEIEVISAEMTEFTDSCLGLGQLNESCLQAITPGWLVLLNVEGQEYEVHTDETGEQARIAPLESQGAADPEAATAAAVALLAGELGVAEAEIELVSLEGAEFTDSCLGLGQANESCLQAITPGWRVVLSAGGQEYEVRTDATGGQARIADESA